MRQRIFPIIIIATGVGLFSLVTIIINPVTTPVKSWFAYQKGDPLDPASYTRAVGNPGCNGHGILCAVYAEVSPNNVYQPSFHSLEELAAQSANFHQVVPGLVEQRNTSDPPYPGMTGTLPQDTQP